MIPNDPSRNLPLLSPMIYQPFIIINKAIILTLAITCLIMPTQLSPSSSSAVVLCSRVTANNNPNANTYYSSSYDKLANGVGVAAADSSDLEYYSDEEYYQMAAEYEDNLRASLAAAEEKKIAEQSENGASADGKDRQDVNQQPHEKKKESYAEMASNLKCDNPWFWNAPKCTWIDVKARHIISRTKRNAKTSAWFLGIIFGPMLLCFCFCCCCYQLKLRNRRKMLKLRQKYTPGVIHLPNGKIATYEPTEEENKAYEELVRAIIVQEMAYMI